MELPATLDLRAFLPAKDFGVSKKFYAAMGFTKTWEGDRMAEFRIGHSGFFLQDYYQEAWAQNCMMNLVVPDVAAWHAHVRSAKLVEAFPGVKVSEPTVQPVGIILYVHDPAGVLWHIQQRPTTVD